MKEKGVKMEDSKVELDPKGAKLALKLERQKHAVPPAHHVIAPAPGTTWSSYLPHWNAAEEPSASGKEVLRKGFENPWPSWIKPDVWQSLSGLEWEHPAQSDEPPAQDPDYEVDIAKEVRWSEPALEGKVKVSWLGHAGILLELPSLDVKDNQTPTRILFDPIFSDRCSPVEYFGPKRFFPTPAPVSALPPIDLVIISHNHYDHLDLPSLSELWGRNKRSLRFLVPLGNASWFLHTSGLQGLSNDSVIEMDWWDTCKVSPTTEGDTLTITCAPAQHGSGRVGLDANTTLWSSWYLTYTSPAKGSFRTFFAGDTGYQFHDPRETDEKKTCPACPAFEEIARRLGAPHLSLLPISVGATLSFLKSYDPFPANWSPLPVGLNEGLTAGNHMPPRDAVRVLKLMQDVAPADLKVARPVAVAIHWGTFVLDLKEAHRTLDKLKKACAEFDVKFARAYDATAHIEDAPCFVALNAGQDVQIPLEQSSPGPLI